MLDNNKGKHFFYISETYFNNIQAFRYFSLYELTSVRLLILGAELFDITTTFVTLLDGGDTFFATNN